MKKFLFINLFAFCVITSQAQYFMVDTLKLNRAERALIKNNSLKNNNKHKKNCKLKYIW